MEKSEICGVVGSKIGSGEGEVLWTGESAWQLMVSGRVFLVCAAFSAEGEALCVFGFLFRLCADTAFLRCQGIAFVFMFDLLTTLPKYLLPISSKCLPVCLEYNSEYNVMYVVGCVWVTRFIKLNSFILNTLQFVQIFFIV